MFAVTGDFGLALSTKDAPSKRDWSVTEQWSEFVVVADANTVVVLSLAVRITVGLSTSPLVHCAQKQWLHQQHNLQRNRIMTERNRNEQK